MSKNYFGNRNAGRSHLRALGYATFAGLVLSACGGEGASSDDAEAPATAEMSASGVLNPNQASAEQLAAVTHLSAELVQQIVDGRPHVSTAEFVGLLGASLTEEQVAEVSVQLFLPINLNSATGEEILSVPGIGERMHREFEEYRPYVAMEQFRREMGKYVDEAEVDRMAQYVFVPIDLNTASDEAIISIPGIGERMLREFKEYRPYVGMEQFRREMGKYVDEGEVARMERYVEIRD
jgi:DNA uptake protein ComE-like DNA-binding protein